MPKKQLRDFFGINPGDNILIEAREEELVIKKVYSVDEALSMPVIIKETPEKIEKDLDEESEFQEELTG